MWVMLTRSGVLYTATDLIKRDMTAHYGRHAGRYVMVALMPWPHMAARSSGPSPVLSLGSWHVALKQNATWVSAPYSARLHLLHRDKTYMRLDALFRRERLVVRAILLILFYLPIHS